MTSETYRRFFRHTLEHLERDPQATLRLALAMAADVLKLGEEERCVTQPLPDSTLNLSGDEARKLIINVLEIFDETPRDTVRAPPPVIDIEDEDPGDPVDDEGAEDDIDNDVDPTDEGAEDDVEQDEDPTDDEGAEDDVREHGDVVPE